jgi:hypothetical protein
MSLDRFVVWTDQQPTREEIGMVLSNFFGGAATIEWQNDRYMCQLYGVNTFPFNGLGNRAEAANRERYAPPFDVRFIEVVVQEDNLDVLTRQQDEYTNCVAQGLQDMFCRYWRAGTSL